MPRYHSTLRKPGIPYRSSHVPPGAELTSCGDPVLTALAQAGANQTGTDRALISLFDAEYQYFIAEATPTSRLQPLIKSSESEPLWLCGAAMPRSHGVCELSLLGDTEGDSKANNNQSAQLPLTLSVELAVDPRFSSKPICQTGPLRRFYAAVPIRTRRGINIGVYCVINETPGVQWRDGHTQRLRDVSQNVMAHLESKRLEVLYKRSIRMNRGLGSFIEGESTLVGLSEFPLADDSTGGVDMEGNLNAIQQALVHRESAELSETGDSSPAADASVPDVPDEEQSSATEIVTSGPSRISRRYSPKHSNYNGSASDENNPATVLSKAANILRESMEIEGCAFMDATTEGYRAPARTSRENGTVEPFAPSSSDDSSYLSSSAEPLHASSVLAFSTSVKSSINGDLPGPLSTALPEKFLAKLLRRYPRGKIFNFGVDGALQSSDSSDDDRAAHVSSSSIGTPSSSDRMVDELSRSAVRKLPAKLWARQREGVILAKAFPGARCVAFAPLWDPRKDRWYAGSFIYTNSAARQFTDVDELSYLRAFSTLTMVEILRNIDLQADKAKSDILGSLSHELRSPLHGVILNAELLAETELSVFQSNAANTIEICSRTLLDTIDHLLHYSKINSFSRHRSQADIKKARLRGASQPVAVLYDAARHGEEGLACNCQLDSLIEEVIESVFAGYTFQQSATHSTPNFAVPTTTGKRGGSGLVRIGPVGELDSQPTGAARVSEEFGNLCVMLYIDPRQDWTYFVQVGAIRRIVMNIFGNALKYTQRGTIKISLAQEYLSPPHRKKEKERVVRFTVEDTGKGIGAEFLRHGLFRPFSQEDTLSPGAGLGLSLVKRIVAELHGSVSVKSQVGTGTIVSVLLPLQQVPMPGRDVVDSDHVTFLNQVEDLKGLRVGLRLSRQNQHGRFSDWHNALRNICSDWLKMEIVPNATGTNAPDVVLWSHDELSKSSEERSSLAMSPNVVLCQNAIVAQNRSFAADACYGSAVFEYVYQPHVLPSLVLRQAPLLTAQ